MADTERGAIVKWILIAAGVLIVVVIGALSAAAVAARQFQHSDTIAPHVRIEGIPVGNMSPQQATEAVRQKWVSDLPKQITLKWPAGKLNVSPEQLGARLQIADAVNRAQRLGRKGGVWSHLITRIQLMRRAVNIPVHVKLDEEVLEAYMIELVNVVNQQPQNAKLKINNGEVENEPGQLGIELDMPQTRKRLARALQDPKIGQVRLATNIQQPSVRGENFKHFEKVLGTYTTKFNPGERDRTHNLHMAIANLGKTVVKPDEVFSLSKRLGPRLQKEGWRAAPIFSEGEVKPATGGGICQVATTTYNAALLANLEIVERHHHSRPVRYAPSGRDATIYWGQLDLKIKNQFDTPVLITGKIEENELSIYVIGERENDFDVKILRSGLQTISHSKKLKPDDNLPVGEKEVEREGRNGYRVTVTQVVKKDGELIEKRTLHTDYYRPQTRIVRVGTKVPGESAAPSAGAPAGQSGADLEGGENYSTGSTGGEEAAKPQRTPPGDAERTPTPPADTEPVEPDRGAPTDAPSD